MLDGGAPRTLQLRSAIVGDEGGRPVVEALIRDVAEVFDDFQDESTV